ncbi:MAG TPA: hypothetical protein VF369_00845, partial [candidate division Zixibacteria bacterium]
MKSMLKICELSLVLSLLVWVNHKSLAMPPYPGLEKQMLSGKAIPPEHLINPRLMQTMGIDQPVVHPISAVYPKGTGAVGSYKALVLLVKFSDNPSI